MPETKKLYRLRPLLIVFFSLSTWIAHAHNVERPSISVVGIGKIEVSADLADLNLGFAVEGMDSGTAMNEVNQRLENLLSQLRKRGVTDADVVAGNLRINPRYDYQGRRPRFTGYVVERSLTVTVKALDNLPAILATTVASKVSNINAVRYRNSQHQSLIAQARKAAIANSKRKATALAAGYNAELGPIYSVVYRGGETTTQPNAQLQSTVAERAMTGRPGGVYLPDQITITDRVDVVFELVPRS